MTNQLSVKTARIVLGLEISTTAVDSLEAALDFPVRKRQDVLIENPRLSGIRGGTLVVVSRQLYPRIKFVIPTGWVD